MSTERKGSVLPESRPGRFGGCCCNQGRAVCNCGMYDRGGPIAPDLPANRWTVLAAIVAVAVAAFVSSLFPMGLAT